MMMLKINLSCLHVVDRCGHTSVVMVNYFFTPKRYEEEKKHDIENRSWLFTCG